MALTPQALGKAQTAGELMEVDRDANDPISDPWRRARHGVDRDQHRRRERVHDVRTPPADRVADEAEGHVTEPHSDLHCHHEG